MRKWAKRWMSMITLGAITLSYVFGGAVTRAEAAEQAEESIIKLPHSTSEIITPDNPSTFRDLSSDEIIQEMGAGWNLGNTMDGHTGLTPSETAWQPNVTTKETIKTVHDMGFNTVRVPVTWGNMINADYSVRESWMNRVQDIVDYCIEQDMYVILNMHHDGAEAMYWFNLKKEGDELEKVWEKFAGLWKTIAERFKNYDEHLIFESMNEVQGGKWDQEEAGTQFGVNINTANQIFVDTVRSTGSNNSRRWLSIPPWGTRIAVAINAKEYGFEMPEDTLEDPRIMLAVHDYAPIEKCLNGTSRDNYDITLSDIIECYEDNFTGLNENYVSKGIPVVLGEYGAVDKDNTPQRELYCEGVNILAKKYQIVGVYWDDGGVDNNAFALVDRKNNVIRQGYETISYALMRGFFTQTDISKVTAGTQITPITDFTLKDTVTVACNDSVKIAVSDVAPAGHNDVILWKTANPQIATVYNGMIRGRSMGETVVTAYAQNGQIAREVKVTVKEQEGTACDSILVPTGDSAVTAYIGHGTFLNARVGTENCDASLRYFSEDESIATVSVMGKITGVSEGSTNIVIVSSTGFSRKVPVTVENAPWDNSQFRLALHIYYNDTGHEFYDDIMSTDIVTVQGPGQYCVKFDCATDLTARAQEAGITTINNAAAIYLKDVDVDEGNITKSILKSGSISYQCIRINNDKTLAIRDKKKAFPLVKDNHIIDTNNPINAWGDYAIAQNEINVSDYQITYKRIAEPTVIEVYFTLSDMYYDDDTVFQSPDGNEPTLALPTDSPDELPDEVSDEIDPTEKPKDDGDQVGTPTEKPQDNNNTSPTVSPSPINKGTVFLDNASQAKYQITKFDAKKGTVAYVKCNGKKSAVSVPSTVTFNGVKYAVTEIGKKAFSQNKKIKRVTLGKNITQIGKKAFSGCKSLKKVVIQSTKLSKIGKKAFGSIDKKATIKVPKKKYKKYKKLLNKKAGITKKMKLLK